jgi:hypothetical protein
VRDNGRFRSFGLWRRNNRSNIGDIFALFLNKPISRFALANTVNAFTGFSLVDIRQTSELLRFRAILTTTRV